MDHKYKIEYLLEYIANNINPWITILSLTLLVFCGWKTLFGTVVSNENKTGLEVVREYFRQHLLLIAILLHIVFIFGLFILSIIAHPELNKLWYISLITTAYINTIRIFWPHILFLLSTFVLISFYWHRTIYPFIQQFIRNNTVKKSVDKISDIRDEINELSSNDFIPSDYYKDDYFFFGLNDKDEPIYLSDKDFSSRHSKILGPSQTGKGVGLGVLIDQAIKKGWGVWFNDIKPDDFIYHIMQQACNESNRTLKYLDLNGTHGTYEPFKHGTIRQREERIKRACKLNDTGTNADHYKLGNRQILDLLMPYWDGSLTHLSSLLNGENLPSNISEEEKELIQIQGGTLRERVREFSKLDVLKPSSNRQQMNINELMKNGDVVYIKGSLTDDLVRNANISLLDEFIQFGLSQKQDKHIFMVLDEVRFLVTDKLANSLATLLSKNINMAIAYQAKNDLENSPDQSLNVGSIMNGIETNTLITISYRGHDEETAQWIAGMTGTQIKNITKAESIELDRFGAEKWTGNKTYGQLEEYLIPTNRILSFSPRVGAFINGGSLACIIKTCWIPVKKFVAYPIEDDPIYAESPPIIEEKTQKIDTSYKDELDKKQKDELQKEADNLAKEMGL